jgi:hypothetical protein
VVVTVGETVNVLPVPILAAMVLPHAPANQYVVPDAPFLVNSEEAPSQIVTRFAVIDVGLVGMAKSN